MDELIDILTSDGKPTGKTALKSEAHKNGWFHATVHIWLYTADKKILLQQRAFTKKVFPGLWDISVAGHIAAGEDILTAAKREVFEELGLPITEEELFKIGTRIHHVEHKNGIIDKEHHHVFIAELKSSVEKLILQKDEVEGVKLFDLEVLTSTKNLENVLLPRFHDYYCMVYDKIESRLKTI
ncbi:NUDIX hydrolase [Polaribacter sp.]|uniref:NUDIX hydrolase n=1 Tax=Polaribacter sp. TaxID=1920175 RepID=UPI003F69804E